MVVEEGTGTGIETAAEGISTPEASLAPTPEAANPAASATPGEAGAVVPPAYTPKHKYVFKDQEKDFPDWAKALAKEEASEKAIKDLLERAEGVDHLKSRRDVLDGENKWMKENWAPAVQTVQKVNQMLKNKDYDSVFEALGIDEMTLFKYVNTRLQLRENPQQLAAYEQQRQAQLESQTWEERAAQAEAQAQEMSVRQRTMELDFELMKPEVSGVIKAFEERIGQPGAFKAEVIRRGQAYAALKQDIPASQAVQEVLKLIGWQGAAAPSPSPGVQPNQPQGNAAPKPTIPNVKGKGTSPARAIPKSLDEMRKLAKEMRDAERA